MGEQAPQPPQPPSPQATAAAQTGENVDTAVANANLSHVNQTDSHGDTSTYSQSGSSPFTDPVSGTTYNIPNYTQTTSLSPANQDIYNTNQGTQQEIASIGQTQAGNIGGILNTPVSLGNYNTSGPNMDYASVSGAPTLGGLPNDPKMMGLVSPDFSAPAAPDPQAGITGMMDAQFGPNGMNAGATVNNLANTQWEQPFNQLWGQNQEQENQSLADQGVTTGSAAWNTGQNQFSQQEQNAQDTYASNMYGTAASLYGNTEGTDAGAYSAGQNTLASEFGTKANEFATQAAQAESANATATGLFGAEAGATNTANANALNKWSEGNAANLAAAGQNSNTSLSDWQAQNSAVTAQNQADLTRRQEPINEVSALMGGSQVAPPNFSSVPQSNIPTTDYSNIVNQSYQNQLAAYNEQVANTSANNGGLFGLGGAVLGGLGRVGAAAL
jgi:hypothetical protein